jgi:putative acetyltransferase
VKNHIIRPIKSNDNKALATIIRNAFKDFNASTRGTVYEDPTTDNLYTLFQTAGSICWVAQEGENILGSCGIFPTENLPDGCAELVKLYLAANARGKGIGKALMLQCILSAKEMGYKQLYIESLPQFGTAVGMYERMGFVFIKHPLGNSGHSGCNIWMIKDLRE